jgi:hypothetical protein
MVFDCRNGRCNTPRWMGRLLLAAGSYHILFALWTNAWPHLGFDWCGLPRPNHPMLWRALGLVSGALGLGFLIASRNPIQHWPIVLVGFFKATVSLILIGLAIFHQDIPFNTIWFLLVDDLIWWLPFAMILWAALQAHAGIPPDGSKPLTLTQAAEQHQLSDGNTLAQASQNQTIALVFLRHFGCTFTRQILRGLENLRAEAESHGARLVLVHMLQNGQETAYLGEKSGVARIADPRCQLYRAFGLGKGGFWELFGPRVWWRGAISVFRGCGVGHLAGDGLQMPGAFLFKNNQILAAQPAATAADLPDLPALFQGLPSTPADERLHA